MPNYQETTDSGDIITWNRARQIVCDNPITGAPGVTIHETKAIRLPDGTTFEPGVGSLSYAMDDPSVEIPLINPDTWEQTAQTMTAGQIWLAMASVYIWMAKQRDGGHA